MYIFIIQAVTSVKFLLMLKTDSTAPYIVLFVILAGCLIKNKGYVI